MFLFICLFSLFCFYLVTLYIHYKAWFLYFLFLHTVITLVKNILAAAKFVKIIHRIHFFLFLSRFLPLSYAFILISSYTFIHRTMDIVYKSDFIKRSVTSFHLFRQSFYVYMFVISLFLYFILFFKFYFYVSLFP